ncbi:MAG: FtsX-like permease family protein [Verrucomicrobiota bacterium]
MTKPTPTGWASTVIVAGVFLLLGLAALTGFVQFAEPPERQPRLAFNEKYSEAPLLDVLRQNGVAATLAAIATNGSRLSGSPGFYRTEKLISDRFRAAGLEVQTQELPVVVPVTEVCEILDAQGQPLPGVTLYPFMPAGLLPTALPAAGLSGTLLVTDSTDLKYLTGHKPEDTIPLTFLDAAGGWSGLASVGVPALIVREDELYTSMKASPDDAGPWLAPVTMDEQAFPRFLARGPIGDFAGQRVTIRCRVVWQEKIVRNIIGVWRSPQPRAEALVLTAYYDSNSVVPDLAPGAEQSVGVATLVELAQALAGYRDSLQRDVIFVAVAGHCQGFAGEGRLLEAIETFSARRSEYRSFAQRRQDEQQAIDYATQALTVVGAPVGDPQFQAWFEKEFLTVAGEINLQRREEVLLRRLEYLRAGTPVYRAGFDPATATDDARKDPANSHPLLRAFIEAKTLENRAANFMSTPLAELARQPEFTTWDYAGQARAHFTRVLTWHQQQLRELDDLVAVQKLFAPYARTLTLNLELFSGGAKQSKDLALLVGVSNPGNLVEPQVSELANLLREKSPPPLEVVHWSTRDAIGSYNQPNRHGYGQMGSVAWHLCGRQAFTVTNYEFVPAKIGSPDDTLEGLPADVLRVQVPAVGRAVLAIANGRVPFKTIAADSGPTVLALAGNTYAAAGASSIVATHPMGERTFLRFGNAEQRNLLPPAARGLSMVPLVAVNPHGRYERNLLFNYNGWSASSDVDAARFDAAGQLLYIKDNAPAAQQLFRSSGIPAQDLKATGWSKPSPIQVVLFRCAPVSLFNQINPQTMKAFGGVSYLSSGGLNGPARQNAGLTTMFLEPDFRFYVGLRDGAAGNPEIQEYRAFMLNVDGDAPARADEPELFGRGYLAADTPALAFPHMDAAGSLLRTAEKRLVLQQKFNMADKQMLGFHEQAKDWLADATSKRASNDTAGAVIAANTSLAYAINNHPVIRQRIAHAVIGILWYLGWLVPFVFFAEKLLWGYTDIRKQLLACGLIFLVVFALLRVFHPAFEMVRSSLVILLGFIILLLTLLVTMLVGGKFKQNIKDLRRREGRVDSADVSRSGVIGTAFMLGLNNMRRRKVRTGLTCLTLVLMTFVMICFTSVSTDLTNEEHPTGRSNWNGLMLRADNYQPLNPAEISSFRQIFGTRFPINTHQWLVTSMAGGQPRNLEIVIDREFLFGEIKTAKRAAVNSAVLMNWTEPQFTGLDRLLLTKRTWFPRPPETRLEAKRTGYKAQNYVILPDTVARALGISVEDVNTGTPTVTIRSEVYTVLGIIDSLELTKVLGPDGKSILPYDLNSVQNLGSIGSRSIVPEDVAHLGGAQVILVNKLPVTEQAEEVLAVNCAILFPKQPYRLTPTEPEQPAIGYRQQRKVVLEYLERSGQAAYYAVDGVSYFGSRRRDRSVTGIIELLVPILIAALTVFNTMRGSVYERKDEIYVYNAVGIAPNHVFFIFMAEALVYAVVGAMLGYLLSQASGRLLTALGLTGGLNMDYSSIETIYASLAIMVAVLLSTILPARDAARLAAPSETRSWELPSAATDDMVFSLPFTFTAHDRVAVVSYFAQWLDANGAGSSGPFYCAPPQVELQTEAQGVVPAIRSTVWLKPYDLGVSQQMEISLPTDPETGEFIARVRLQRLSGNVAAWQRTLKPFLGVVRKQFLNWRVTTTGQREELFVEAKQMLQEANRHG